VCAEDVGAKHGDRQGDKEQQQLAARRDRPEKAK
jgi:hypothetical protein